MKLLRKLYRMPALIAYLPGFLVGTCTLLLLISNSCSLEEKGESGLRAHDDIIQGVSHGYSAMNGPRYCKSCHGVGLQGGKNGEPSCFQCHGENWNPIDPDTARGDADHTVNNDGFFHHSGLANPTTNCTACHGASLQGDEARTGNPSCFLCHDQKW